LTVVIASILSQKILTGGQKCPTLGYYVRGSEFIRRVEKTGKERNVTVQYAPRRGKGSHGTLFYGQEFTIIRNPKDELKTGTQHAMLRQLGLKLSDIQ
jgi:mRNA interferase HicA